MKLFTNIAAFAVVATVACLREAIAAREFFLRMYADNCGDLPDLDGNGEDNGRGNDALIQLWINGKEVDEFAYYRPNTNSPNWNWATNILQDVALGSTIEYRLNDYDRNEGNRQEYIGKLTFKLPTNPNVWSSSQFGYRGKYGEFYANQCEIGEYVDAKGYCVSCDQGFFCPDGVSKALCDAGTFASGRGATTSCATCPAGTYQPGRGQSECLPCPDGEYSSGTSNSKCSLCREGYYGKGNAARTSDTCTGKCTQGYYCPKGSSSAKQNECGGINLFCPTGSPLPKVVSDGYYTYSRSGDDNNVNARINQRECEPGYKCKGGAKIACGENEYVESKAAETCNSCLDLSCTQHKFRAGCGGGSKGTCTDCKIRPATQSQECTTGFNKCPGNTLIDVSACKECECTDPGLQWKKLESSGSCPKCMPCTYTESNCNDADAGNVPNDPTNNMYLEDECRADSRMKTAAVSHHLRALCANGNAAGAAARVREIALLPYACGLGLIVFRIHFWGSSSIPAPSAAAKSSRIRPLAWIATQFKCQVENSWSTASKRPMMPASKHSPSAFAVRRLNRRHQRVRLTVCAPSARRAKKGSIKPSTATLLKTTCASP